MCPCCAPDTATPADPVKSTLVNMSGGKPKLGNVDICYVCQKGGLLKNGHFYWEMNIQALKIKKLCCIADGFVGGKLLCCDLCDQSYHPKCIDAEFLDPMIFDESGKWGCPICYGKDPLKNMSHKRLTKQDRERKSALWQKCIARESRRCRANRDRFLYSCLHALEPFVEPYVLAKLKKDAAAASKFFASKPQAKSRRDTREAGLHQDASSSEASSRSQTGKAEHKSEEGFIRRTSSFSDSDTGTPATPTAVDSSQSGQEPNMPDAVLRKSSELIEKEQSVLYREEALWRDAERRAMASGSEILREGVRLKAYQRWGINWLLDAFNHKAGAILADEMGMLRSSTERRCELFLLYFFYFNKL